MLIRISSNIQINLGIIGVSIILSWLIGIVTILGLLGYTNLYQEYGINLHLFRLLMYLKNFFNVLFDCARS